MSETPDSNFDAFWLDPANSRWCSTGETGTLAATILNLCGGGALLDVGCGAGRLLDAIRVLGVDARGIDASPAAVALCNAVAPGTALVADALSLPCADQSFDTIVCSGLPDLLSDAQLKAFLEKARRIARRSIVLVSGANAWPAHAAGLVQHRSREQVQAIAFDAGLRRHPGELRAVPYSMLEADPVPRLLAFEPVAPDAAVRFPRSFLDRHHDLHDDHLRSSGRRADAHLARYALACELVRDGDQVIDIACGMGYGTRMLALCSTAAMVRGIDSDPGAVEYAAANYQDVRATFGVDDATQLQSIRDQSADLVVSFETLEHLEDPAALLARAHAILRPGGRIIVSVPNLWADHTGTDPNPHHHHVYSRDLLRAQLERHFIIERTYRQTAGGGWKLHEQPRRLELLGDSDTAPAEWLLMVAMKSPVGAGREFQETLFPAQPADPEYNLYNFSRDYDNPALFRSMICMGPRLSSDARLVELAAQVAAQSRPGSADQGAALCVLAYQTLATPTWARALERVEQLDTFARASDGSPHARRWVISAEYVAARLLLAIGDRGGALKRFASCASMDAAAFSPVLGTKTVDACCWAGILRAYDGHHEDAREWWMRGIQEARRLTTQPWLNVIGQIDSPQPCGLFELSQVLDAASHCAGWLFAAPRLADQPGMAGVMARRQTCGDTRQYIKDLLAAKSWLEGQLSSRASQRDLEAQIKRLNEALTAAESSRTWLNQQVRNFKAAALKAASDYEKAHEWAKAADGGRQWLESQLESSKAREARQSEKLEELCGYVKQLEEARVWLDGQRHGLTAQLEQREQAIGQLQARLAAAEARAAQLEAAAAEAHEQIARQTRVGDVLTQELIQAQSSLKANQAQLATTESELARSQAFVTQLSARGFMDRLLNREPRA